MHDGFSHICTFAHLSFAHLQKSFGHVKTVLRKLRVSENVFLRTCVKMKFIIFTEFQRICKFEQFFEKSEKSRNFSKMSDSVPSVFDVFPKMSEKSSRVPEWYTSGFLGQRV